MSDRILEIRTQMIPLVAQTFNVAPETVSDESGPETIAAWDSLGHLRMMMAVERKFKLKFKTEQLSAPQSVADLCRLVAQEFTRG